VRLAAEIWSEAELMEFRLWLAGNPLAGDVIPGAGGLRKVRWSRPGMGKRGGARVVYFNQLSEGVIALVGPAHTNFSSANGVQTAPI
jgi:hypothetical protein